MNEEINQTNIPEAEDAVHPSGSETQDSKANTTPKTAETNIKSAWKQVENIGQALGDALQGRGNVVMVRVNDEALGHLDMLVEAEVVKSRSEAAALLINEGIQANREMFEKISAVTQQITALRDKLKETVKVSNFNQD
ncbi:MAG: hypothetical protein CVU39_09795 [Chloroflexi bacterium HGW-Chloroflexi-10]|nr:MAG: hypothetical protein CVU39_09795 [Chloroflexi bacterium HGW-Chloroflexi-10]